MEIILACLGVLAGAVGLLLPPLQALLPRLSLVFYYRQSIIRRLFLLAGLILAALAILVHGSILTWTAFFLIALFCLLEELLLVPRKVIPPLDDPPARPVGSVTLPEEEMVLGLETRDRAHAYPLALLIPHHIINETIGGTPVAATYCPACRSGFIYDPVVQGRRLTFEPVSVHRRNMVMRDRETGTVWQHETGLALMGPYKGERLNILGVEMCNWKGWKCEHPDSTVCQPPEGYRHPSPLGHVFGRLLDEGPKHLVGPGLHGLDERLEQHETIIGLSAGGRDKAYPLRLVKAAGILPDQLGDVPVLLVYEKEIDRVRAYERIAGGRVTGKLIPVRRQWWLAWSEYHPGSDV